MRRIFALAALLALAFEAGAVVLYKSIDANGRVTYSDQPPAGNGARVVVPIDVDYPPVAAPWRPPVAMSGGEEVEQIIRRRPASSDDSRVRAAQARLDHARAALESAQNNSAPEDWIYLGNRHRAPRPDYLARLESLQADVNAAEQQLADEERRLRLGF